MIEEDTNEYDTDRGFSPKLKQKIERLIKEDEAQRERTWSYYEKLRKKDPDTYYSTKTVLQMHQDAADLGKAFQDGTYNAWYQHNRTT